MIYIASPTSSDILVSDAEVPIWPVANDQERESVVSMADMFETSVCWTEPHDAGNVRGVETVVALGNEVASIGRLYAHLTNRNLTLVPASQTPIIEGCSVILGLMSQISGDLIEHIYRTDRNYYPGLVVGRDLIDLRRKALVSALTAVTLPRSRPSVFNLQPRFDFGIFVVGETLLIGSASPPEARKALLKHGRSVVAYCGHSDGIDADLGRGLVLCPRDERWPTPEAAANRTPICYSTAWCYRHNREIDATAGSRIHPALIRTRLLLWNTCTGIILNDAPMDPSLGVGMTLATSTSIGALMSTWRIELAPSNVTDSLLDGMLHGMTAGEGLAIHNCSSQAKKYGHRLCLFGDPRTRIAPEERSNAPRTKFVHASTSVVSEEPGQIEVRFLRSCLYEARDNESNNRDRNNIKSRIESAAQAVASYELAIWRRSTQDDTLRRKRELLRSFVEFAAHTKLWEFWSPFIADINYVSSTESCLNCGGPLGTHEITFKHLPVRRTISNCRLCGIVADKPRDWIIMAKIQPNEIQIIGELPAGMWASAITAKYKDPVSRQVWLLPSHGDVEGLGRVPVPEALLPFPVTLSFTLMCDTQVCVFSRDLPGQPEMLAGNSPFVGT